MALDTKYKQQKKWETNEDALHLTAFRGFPGHYEGGGTQTKSRRLLVWNRDKSLWRLRHLEFTEQSTGEKVIAQRESPKSPQRSPFSIQQTRNQHMHMRELLANEQWDIYI